MKDTAPTSSLEQQPREMNETLPALPTLESVLCTEELDRRPSRPPDYERENRALMSLAKALADSPRTILQTLADTILKVFQCGSAGISLVTEDGKRFHWPAIAGAWEPYIGEGTPRDFGPCGDVLDRNCHLLFRHFERRYTYFLPVTPPVEECLLVPFYVAGKAVGTIWAITHADRPGVRKFDSEDLRMLVSLGIFASAAYQTVEQLHALRDQAHDRLEATQGLREMNEALLVSSVSQHELAEQARKAEATIQAQSAALADESRRKDEFLAMLSHELRNPLAPIRSAVHLLKLQERGSENFIQREARQIIERQVGNLTKLINDLLEVSRVVSGRIRLDLQIVDLNHVVQHAIETTHPLIRQRKHELVLNLGPDPVWANADPTRMEEVFINLLNNAAKYTSDGGRIEIVVRVECRVMSDETTAFDPPATAVIRVRDNGIGIDQELLPRIFDLFTQADRSLARSAGGLGIGLSLAHRLVDLHGGTIEAHSPPEGAPADAGGSEFIVRLPLMQAPEMPQPVAPDAETRPKPEGIRVLVVDDNMDNAKLLSRALQHAGYGVQSAYTGPDGLKVALQWRPDIVLLDIGLPGMDGYEVARRLRADPSAAGMRLIAATGYGRDTDIALAREAGFDAHLVKPYDFDHLEKLMVPHS